MKIVLVLPHLTRIGGAARYAWELGEFLTGKGDEVVIVSLYTDEKLYNSQEIKIINLADRTFLPQSIKLNTINENNNLSDLIIYVEPFRNFLEILQKVPGYSIDIFLKRVPRLINEPYTKEMGIKIPE